MPVVPLQDLSRQTEALFPPISEAVLRVVKSGWYSMGDELVQFESEFSAFLGADHCVGVANGTDALELALKAAGVGSGDDVLTVANAGMYAVCAILATGATPCFVDIDPVTMNMSPDSLKEIISSKHAAVITTHLYGRMADISRICEIAQQQNVPVIEDCAQSVGATVDGKASGTWGAAGCFSFYPTKNLGALGDAGAVVTNHPKIFENLKFLRQYGWTEKYRSDISGGRNSRMDEIQAAILRVKIPYLKKWIETRRGIIRTYRKSMGESDTRLAPDYGEADCAHLCVLQSGNRDLLRTKLNDVGVSTDIHYPILDYNQLSVRARSDINTDGLSLPVSENVTNQILTIPCFPELTGDEIAHISNSLKLWAESTSR